MWAAVGLGNPGTRYEYTRHNAGARAAQRLAEILGARLRPSKGSVLIGEARSVDARLLVGRPTTYMNESGRAVSFLVRWFKLDAGRLIVVHDDIDLQAGALRLKRGGGSGGHRGIESIVTALGTNDFYRVRIGVGRPDLMRDPADWVLEPMARAAADELAHAEAAAGEAVLAIVEDGLELAMNRFNTR